MIIYILILLSLTGEPNRSDLFFDKDECTEAATMINIQRKQEFHAFCVKN